MLVCFAFYLVNQKYISVLFDTTKGNFWLGLAIFWMFCGVVIMRQMINFKVVGEVMNIPPFYIVIISTAAAASFAMRLRYRC